MFGHKNLTPYWTAAIILASIILYPGTTIISVNLLFAGTVVGVIHIYRTTMGCITGDMIGALGEISQTAALLALTI
jgi:cobalamin synthase